jgi:hypothetical protein
LKLTIYDEEELAARNLDDLQILAQEFEKNFSFLKKNSSGEPTGPELERD